MSNTPEPKEEETEDDDWIMDDDWDEDDEDFDDDDYDDWDEDEDDDEDWDYEEFTCQICGAGNKVDEDINIVDRKNIICCSCQNFMNHLWYRAEMYQDSKKGRVQFIKNKRSYLEDYINNDAKDFHYTFKDKWNSLKRYFDKIERETESA